MHQNIPMGALPAGTKSSDVPVENVWFYVGPSGRLRASHREVCQEVQEGLSADDYRALMSDAYVYHSHTSKQPLTPGEVVEMDISLWPGGIVFDADESLCLEVKGRHPILPEFAGLDEKIVNYNVGRHEVHTGGKAASFLYVALKQS